MLIVGSVCIRDFYYCLSCLNVNDSIFIEADILSVTPTRLYTINSNDTQQLYPSGYS